MHTVEPSRSRLLMAVALSLVAVAGTSLAQSSPDGARPSLDPLVAPWHAEFVAAANAARHDAGLPPQRPDVDLAEAAQIHAEEMAALGYFSHASPTAERATPTARVALVGGPQIAVAENLALIGGPGDLVARTIDGWLASPDHRGNLLRPDHDEVGFGVARNDRGEAYVVQVTASEPRDLVSSDVVSVTRAEFRIVVNVTAERAVDAAIAFGNEPARLVRLAAGATELRLATAERGPLQLRIGVPLGRDAGYVIDAAAWIEPVTGAIEPDGTAPRRLVRITGARSERVVESVIRVHLRYATGLRPLALFVDGVHAPRAEVAPGALEVAVPAGRVAVLTVGVVDGDRATFFHRFTVEPASEGAARLVPGAPGGGGG